MTRWLASLCGVLLVGAASAFGAAGDVLWADIATNGWELRLCIEGVGTNGLPNLGLTQEVIYDADANPAYRTNWTGTSKVRLSVRSPGFDATGAATTRYWSNQACFPKRSPYPNETALWVTNSGSDAIVSFALQDWVYRSDDHISVTVDAGVFGGNAAAALSSQGSPATVTNLSGLPYRLPFVGPQTPGYYRLTNTTQTLDCFAHGAYGVDRHPVACVIAHASDMHGHTTSSVVTEQTLAATTPAARPVYRATLDYSSFYSSSTAWDNVTNWWVVYPWRGDTPIDTSVPMSNNGLCFTTVNLYDPGNTYPECVAVVAPDGDDGLSTEAVTLSTSFDPANPPAAFATVGRAMYECYMWARNVPSVKRYNCGGATIYLKAGTYPVYGYATAALINSNVVHTVIRPFPGVSRENVILTKSAANYTMQTKQLTIMDLTLQQAGDAYVIYGANTTAGYRLVVTNCIIQGSGSAYSTTYGFERKWALGNYYTNALNLDGILVGNTITNGGALGYFSGQFGNLYYGRPDWTSGNIIKESSSSNLIGTMQYAVNNKFMRCPSPLFTLGQYGNQTNGTLLLQNVGLKGEGLNNPIVFDNADGASTDSYGKIAAFNTLTGIRWNYNYDDPTLDGRYNYHLGYTVWGNLTYTMCNKGDVFRASEAYYGNAPVAHGVGCGYNWIPQDNFPASYFGIGSITIAKSAGRDPGYIRASALDAEMPDNDMRLRRGSRMRRLVPNDSLRWDIDGRERGSLTDAGAYESPGEASRVPIRGRRR